MVGIAEYNHEDFDQTRQAEQDEKLLVKFYHRPVADKAASDREGRQVFKEVEYVDIRVPGTRGAGAARPATHKDKQRFPRHYAAFQQRIEMPIEGTPLTEWPMVSRSHAEELAFAGVKTVEQLGSMSDVIAGQMMGGQSFKAKANEWLERAKVDVTMAHLQAELAERDKQIAELADKLEALLADKPKRRRKPKEDMNSDNELSDTGQRPAEPSGSGGGSLTGS